METTFPYYALTRTNLATLRDYLANPGDDTYQTACANAAAVLDTFVDILPEPNIGHHVILDGDNPAMQLCDTEKDHQLRHLIAVEQKNGNSYTHAPIVMCSECIDTKRNNYWQDIKGTYGPELTRLENNLGTSKNNLAMLEVRKAAAEAYLEAHPDNKAAQDYAFEAQRDHGEEAAHLSKLRIKIEKLKKPMEEADRYTRPTAQFTLKKEPKPYTLETIRKAAQRAANRKAAEKGKPRHA